MKSVILIEDNEMNRMVIQDMFEFDLVGARLHQFHSAEEALEELANLDPALVLMDLALPGMTGMEATRRLKSNPGTQDTPVWALTAHAMKGDREQGMRTGFDDYIVKPIDAASLGRRLQNFIGDHELKEAA